MSFTDQRQDQIRQRIREVTEPESDERERLMEAVDDVPFRRLDEIQTETRVVMGARTFERRLRDEFEQVGNRVSPMSSWINFHLQDVDEDYVHRMWKRFWFFTLNAIPAYTPGDYGSFRTHIWKLDELGLIEQTRREPSAVQDRMPKSFYSIVDERTDDPAWRNPHEAMYPSSAPAPILEEIQRSIRQNQGPPDLEAVAAQFDLTEEELRDRMDSWDYDLEEQIDLVLES